MSSSIKLGDVQDLVKNMEKVLSYYEGQTKMFDDLLEGLRTFNDNFEPTGRELEVGRLKNGILFAPVGKISCR